MPNNLVFNGVAEQLQTLINGVDADGNVRPIRTDSDGQIQLGTVTVTAENFDIRPLSGATDSIQLSSRLLTEDSLAFEDVTVATATFVQNTGEQSEYSFYVFNTGSNTLTVQLQISPISTDSYFMDDPSGAVGLESGDKVTLVAGRFLKYTRLFYDTGGEACSFNVHYNAQV